MRVSIGYLGGSPAWLFINGRQSGLSMTRIGAYRKARRIAKAHGLRRTAPEPPFEHGFSMFTPTKTWSDEDA